jgi:hypothetical protein
VKRVGLAFPMEVIESLALYDSSFFAIAVSVPSPEGMSPSRKGNCASGFYNLSIRPISVGIDPSIAFVHIGLLAAGQLTDLRQERLGHQIV